MGKNCPSFPRSFNQLVRMSSESDQTDRDVNQLKQSIIVDVWSVYRDTVSGVVAHVMTGVSNNLLCVLWMK